MDRQLAGADVRQGSDRRSLIQHTLTRCMAIADVFRSAEWMRY